MLNRINSQKNTHLDIITQLSEVKMEVAHGSYVLPSSLFITLQTKSIHVKTFLRISDTPSTMIFETNHYFCQNNTTQLSTFKMDINSLRFAQTIAFLFFPKNY